MWVGFGLLVAKKATGHGVFIHPMLVLLSSTISYNSLNIYIYIYIFFLKEKPTPI